MAGVSPSAEAVIVAVPNPVPVTAGSAYGAVRPPGMYTLVGLTAATPGALVESETLTPPGGAGVFSDSVIVLKAPGATFRLGPSWIAAANPHTGRADNRRIPKRLPSLGKEVGACSAMDGSVRQCIVENSLGLLAHTIALRT